MVIFNILGKQEDKISFITWCDAKNGNNTNPVQISPEAHEAKSLWLTTASLDNKAKMYLEFLNRNQNHCCCKTEK